MKIVYYVEYLDGTMEVVYDKKYLKTGKGIAALVSDTLRFNDWMSLENMPLEKVKSFIQGKLSDILSRRKK